MDRPDYDLTHPVASYAQQVVDGEVLAGRLVVLACERHLGDLETAHKRGLWFDESAATRAIQWYGFLCHTEGEWAGQPIVLEPWQQFIEGALYGWMRADGLRRFRTAYEEEPRKNGKSTRLGGAALYHLIADGEPGAQVYSAATKRDQAKIVWGHARKMVLASPHLAPRIEALKTALVVNDTASSFLPIGADADTSDGLNPSAVVIDELHAHKTREMWDVMDTALGARRQPMLRVITTAGDDPSGVCREQREHSVKVLEGVIEDDEWFAYIATADAPENEADDPDWWLREAAWRQANPNYGVSVKVDDLRRQARKASHSPDAIRAFKIKRLNIWVGAAKQWIATEFWDACPAELDIETLAGRSCFIGLDLSSKIDLSAAVKMFPPAIGEREWAMLARLYMPEERIADRESADRVPYRRWVDEGWITATPGNVIDHEWIRNDINDDSDIYHIQEVDFDPFNATNLASNLADDGHTTVEMRQGFRTMSEPTKSFEALVLERLINHGGNPVLRWMLSNVIVRRDPNDNYMPDKGKATGRIDGIVAAIMGLGRGQAVHGHNQGTEIPDDYEIAVA